jgi:hypothetical protein
VFEKNAKPMLKKRKISCTSGEDASIYSSAGFREAISLSKRESHFIHQNLLGTKWNSYICTKQGCPLENKCLVVIWW